MKTFYTCLVVLFFTTMPAFGQNKPMGGNHQPPNPEKIVAMMQSKLNLTQDQVNAVTPIIEKYASKRQELRQSMQGGTADMSSIRSQMKQIKADQTQELSQVLSPAQLSQWEQMMSQMKGKFGSKGGGSWGSGGGNGGNN